MIFTIQRLSDKSGVAPSTCRYWLVNLFKEFAPSQVDSKWPEDALDVVLKINELKKQQLDNEEIRDVLGKTLTVNAEPQTKAIVPRADAEFYQNNFEVLTQIIQNQNKHLDLLEKLLLKLLGEQPVNKETTKPAVRRTAAKKRPVNRPSRVVPPKKKGFFERLFS